MLQCNIAYYVQFRRYALVLADCAKPATAREDLLQDAAFGPDSARCFLVGAGFHRDADFFVKIGAFRS